MADPIRLATLAPTVPLPILPAPVPRRAACLHCGGGAEWIDCPTGGWWAHDVHPADGHDAEATS